MARESVCWKHTETPASARCRQCSKPICKACVVESNGETFCSTACVNRNTEYNARNPQGVPKKGGFMAMVVKLITLIILLAIGIVVADKVFHVAFARQLMEKIGM